MRTTSKQHSWSQTRCTDNKIIPVGPDLLMEQIPDVRSSLISCQSSLNLSSIYCVHTTHGTLVPIFAFFFCHCLSHCLLLPSFLDPCLRTVTLSLDIANLSSLRSLKYKCILFLAMLNIFEICHVSQQCQDTAQNH